MEIEPGQPFFYKANKKTGNEFLLDKTIPLQYCHMRSFFDKINEILVANNIGRLSQEVS